MHTTARALTPQDRRELAAAALLPERSVSRAYSQPDAVRPTTLVRVARAARALGLPLPPGAEPAVARP